MSLTDDIVNSGSVNMDPDSLLAKLNAAERERDDLRAALTQAQRANRTEDFVRERVRELIGRPPPVPEWKIEIEDKPGHPGVPVLFLSDLHIGEVVRAAEVNGVNAFNTAVAEARLEAIVRTATDLWMRHLRHEQAYDKVVVLLGGDIIAGIIHSELTATNDREIMVQVLEAVRLLWSALCLLEDVFGSVQVVCVPGNHGRTTMKPRFKGYAGTSFDWLIYELLKLYAAQSDESIEFVSDENRRQLVEIAGHRTLLVHGDQFRGGDGIIGPVGPVTRGDVRMRDISVQMPGDHHYDLLAYGHHHRASWSPQAIGNGSLVGYSEYADGNILRFERPIQMAWTVHPRHGINWIMPIYAPACEDLWD